MLKRTHRAFFDSFKAARGELEPLFSAMKSEEHMRNEVRQYIVPAFSHGRRHQISERLGRAQQRSLFRTNVSFVIQEARRRGNYRVAAAALDVALSETSPSHFAQEFEPAWVKDAVASCETVEELQKMEKILRKHEQQLLAGGTVAGTEGFLLTAAFGRSPAAVTEGGRRLGDEDDALEANGEDQTEEAADIETSVRRPSALTTLPHRSDHNGKHAVRFTDQGSLMVPTNLATGAVTPTVSDEARVSTALTQPPSSNDLAVYGGSGIDASLWSSPEARAAAGLRRLQRQHRDLTAGPNVSFTRYFLHQRLVRTEDELMALYRAMRSRPQDIAFRVVGGSPYADTVHEVLRCRRGIHRVSWLPLSMGAYTLDTRDSVPHDTVLSNRHLLRSLARERLIVYQSLPSMLPVLFLDPQAGETVLDLCASPGNKTGLILDTMHGTGTAVSSSSSLAVPTLTFGGCVVANEAQVSRLRDLQERLGDVSPEVAVTRGRGEAFGGASSPTTTTAYKYAGINGEGLYDGVLVDAPCSGEGRMGRDALSWRLWHPSRSLEFFPLQCALLQQAVQLCKLGGRVVYATCTLNPLENEAVVAAVLHACGGTVELVPAPTHLLAATSSRSASRNHNENHVGEESDNSGLPVLRLTPGLCTWDVPSSAGGFLRTAAEAYARGEGRSRLRPEMFAPEEQQEGEGERSAIGAALHRCCRRVMPHLNGNADGFFVAVLRKTAMEQRHSPNAWNKGSTAGVAVSALSGVSRVAASSLAVSFAGGSNLLTDRGFLQLQASNHLVHKHLGGFFVPSSLAATPQSSSNLPLAVSQQQQHKGCASVQSFLDRHRWTAMWCEDEGLRLLSTCAVQLLRTHSTTAGAMRGGSSLSSSPTVSTPTPPNVNSTELLSAGVLVVNARGELTERGAALLRHSASGRVLTLPLPYAQFLLANRTLDIGGSLRLMPAFMQEAELALNPHRGLLTYPGSHTSEKREDDGAAPQLSSPQWCLNALTALRDGAAGNAIVCIDVPSSSSRMPAATAVQGGSGAGSSSSFWAASLSQWSWPVRVEVLHPWTGAHNNSNPENNVSAGLVRLHLLLSPASRHRALALIGRLQAHAHRLRGTPAQQQQAQLQASATYAPSFVMGERELHGVPTQASHQHRQLFRGERPSDLDASRGGHEASSRCSPSTAFSSAVFEL